MPLPTTAEMISASILAQLATHMSTPTPATDRLRIVAQEFRDSAQLDADEIAGIERKHLAKQDEVWQARAERDGDEVGK